MTEREEPREYLHEPGWPLQPSALPPDLGEFLRGQAYACLTHPTDQGVVLVVKIPGADIKSVRGRVPIHLQHELYEHPLAPVIRMLTTIYDRPSQPLKLETFINVGDPEQRADYETLSSQERLHLLFFDENLSHRLTKQLQGLEPAPARLILARADALAARIDPGVYDFDHAKAAVLAVTSL